MAIAYGQGKASNQKSYQSFSYTFSTRSVPRNWKLLQMDPFQEKSIISNIVSLKKRTVNISVLLTKLVQVGVLISIEKDAVLGVCDDEQRLELFYEIILRKPSDSFQYFLKCLRESGNTSLAALVEESWANGNRSRVGADKNVTPRLKRGSSIDRYLKEDIGNTPIHDYEMGIAEILEENPTLRKDWKLILHMLNLSQTKIGFYEVFPTFIFKVTMMLRDWVCETKMKPTLANLCILIDKQGIPEISGRIRTMFERYEQEAESGFLFQLQSQANIPILGQENEISRVLEDNPDFGLKPENVFLLLNLPDADFSKYLKNSASFIETSAEMTKIWGKASVVRRAV